MANNPKRVQDPTEAAMSAIQEALNRREDAPPPPPPDAAPPPAPDPFANMTAGLDIAADRPARRRPTRSAPPIDEDLFLQDTREPAPPSSREPGARDPFTHPPTPADLEDVKPAQRAANDDRQSVGQVLQSLQRRPSRAPYFAAFLLSIAWVVVGLAIGASYFGGDLRALTQQGAHPLVF